LLKFCFREKYNAVNTPAATMQSPASITCLTSKLAMNSAVVSIILPEYNVRHETT